MKKQATKCGDPREYRRHYSEQQFWRKLSFLPRTAGMAVIEKSLLLYAILTDPDTPMWARALVIGALGYFIWPMDMVPDAVPVAGYVDDVAVMGVVLTQLGRFVTPAMQERVQRLLPEGMKSAKKSTKKERTTKKHEQVEGKGSGGGES